jgi:hypothetical protein
MAVVNFCRSSRCMQGAVHLHQAARQPAVDAAVTAA